MTKQERVLRGRRLELSSLVFLAYELRERFGRDTTEVELQWTKQLAEIDSALEELDA